MSANQHRNLRHIGTTHDNKRDKEVLDSRNLIHQYTTSDKQSRFVQREGTKHAQVQNDKYQTQFSEQDLMSQASSRHTNRVKNYTKIIHTPSHKNTSSGQTHQALAYNGDDISNRHCSQMTEMTIQADASQHINKESQIVAIQQDDDTQQQIYSASSAISRQFVLSEHNQAPRHHHHHNESEINALNTFIQNKPLSSPINQDFQQSEKAFETSNNDDDIDYEEYKTPSEQNSQQTNQEDHKTTQLVISQLEIDEYTLGDVVSGAVNMFDHQTNNQKKVVKINTPPSQQVTISEQQTQRFSDHNQPNVLKYQYVHQPPTSSTQKHSQSPKTQTTPQRITNKLSFQTPLASYKGSVVSKKIKGGVQEIRKQVLNRIYDPHNNRDNSKNNIKSNNSEEALIINQSNMPSPDQGISGSNLLDEALIINQSNIPSPDHGIFGSNLSSLLSRAPVQTLGNKIQQNVFQQKRGQQPQPLISPMNLIQNWGFDVKNVGITKNDIMNESSEQLVKKIKQIKHFQTWQRNLAQGLNQTPSQIQLVKEIQAACEDTENPCFCDERALYLKSMVQVYSEDQNGKYREHLRTSFKKKHLEKSPVARKSVPRSANHQFYKSQNTKAQAPLVIHDEYNFNQQQINTKNEEYYKIGSPKGQHGGPALMASRWARTRNQMFDENTHEVISPTSYNSRSVENAQNYSSQKSLRYDLGRRAALLTILKKRYVRIQKSRESSASTPNNNLDYQIPQLKSVKNSQYAQLFPFTHGIDNYTNRLIQTTPISVKIPKAAYVENETENTLNPVLTQESQRQASSIERMEQIMMAYARYPAAVLSQSPSNSAYKQTVQYKNQKHQHPHYKLQKSSPKIYASKKFYAVSSNQISAQPNM